MYSILSCSASSKKSGPNKNISASSNSIPDTLTLIQKSAFDALNTLQVSTDEMNRIYSTFPNINQPCYPPDTSFNIPQSKLLEAMNEFLLIYGTNLTDERRTELAAISVQAQNNYIVNFCPVNFENSNYENGLPLKGIWVLPNILGRRDLTLVW